MLEKMKSLIKRIFGTAHKPPGLFSGVPGPSPWYIGAHYPEVTGFEWQEAGEGNALAGKTVLRGPSGPVLIVGYYHYVTVIEGSLLLIWRQKYEKEPPTLPVNIIVIDPLRLAALGDDLSALCNAMEQKGITLLYEGTPIAKCDLDTTVTGKPLHFEFPSPINRIKELLILCHSSDRNPSLSRREYSDLALLVARPVELTYELYPQDWFNNSGDWDYGYEWVTRVAREPLTGKIYGEGIRISPFVLDTTLRQVEKYLKDLP